MKSIALFVCFALALSTPALSQAIGESARISQQTLKGTGSVPTVPASPLNSRTGRPQQSGVQVVNDMYRGLPDCHCAQPPVFLPGPKDVAPGTPVILTTTNPNAVIYYTTDGWTPTESSNQYATPIFITANTRIQAFAKEPGKGPSPIIAANYVVNGPSIPSPIDASVSGSSIPKGTLIRFQTGNRMSSESANVGDRFYVLLDQNLVVNGKVIAPRGMSVDAMVTSVQHSGQNGKSGSIVFRLMGLSAQGTTIPLEGIYTLVAPDIGSQLNHISDASFVHVAGPLPPGNEAKIEPGMALTASVAADVALSQ